MMRLLLKLLRPSRSPDFIVGNDYLRRWWLIPRNRLFNVYLHEFRTSDDDRALHDHPWLNLSMLLQGFYFEHTPAGVFVRRPGDLVARWPTSAHRIELPVVGEQVTPCWTLFITGPRVREWGFHCPKGWVHWRTFTNPSNTGQVGRGCD